MVAKGKPTIETLSKLGKRKLAELLIAEAAGNCQLTQTLNFAISAEEASGTHLKPCRRRDPGQPYCTANRVLARANEVIE